MIAVNLMRATGDSGGSPPAADLDAFTTPTEYTRAKAPNGSFSTPLFTVSASGGTPPYSYSWEANYPGATLSDVDGVSTRVALSGYNDVASFDLVCTVTDDVGDTVEASSYIFIQFGLQL